MYEYLSFSLKNIFYTKLLGKQNKSRVELVKNITRHLERFNIVYVKIFQSLCLEKDILNEDEKDYLMKYTDKVPYSNDDIDFDLLDKLEEEFDIVLDNKMPINSGIVGVVFKGINKRDNEKRIVVKMLKRGIVEKYNKAYSDLELLVKYLEWVPYVNNINYVKMIEDSKESILSQADFTNECYNIEFFNKKYENNKEFVLPKVYSSITEKMNNVIVMTDITGLTYNDIKDFDESVKYEFAKLFNKFGILGTLCYSCVQGDFHAGNVFFYLNDKADTDKADTDKADTDKDGKPKYQLGIIDFGLCHYYVPENQNAYFTFFYNIQVKKELDKIFSVVPILIENIDYFNTFNIEKKQILFTELKECIKTYLHSDLSLDYMSFFFQLSKIFKSYGLIYTKEFNNMCISLQITNSIGSSLSSQINKIQRDVMNDFVQIDKLIEIEEQ